MLVPGCLVRHSTACLKHSLLRSNVALNPMYDLLASVLRVAKAFALALADWLHMLFTSSAVFCTTCRCYGWLECHA